MDPKIYLFDYAETIYNVLEKDPRWKNYLIYTGNDDPDSFVITEQNVKKAFEFMFDFIETIMLMGARRKRHFYKWIAVPYLRYQWKRYESRYHTQIFQYVMWKLQKHPELTMTQIYQKLAREYMNTKVGEVYKEALGLTGENMHDYGRALFPKRYPVFPDKYLRDVFFSQSPKTIRKGMAEIYNFYFNRQTHIVIAVHLIMKMMRDYPGKISDDDRERLIDIYLNNPNAVELDPDTATWVMTRVRAFFLTYQRIRH